MKKFVVLDKNGDSVEVTDFLKRKAGEALTWAKGHKKDVAEYATLALAFVGLIKKSQPTQYERERDRIDHTYYDPSTGIHWALKRKMTNTQKALLVQRKKRGEDAYTILTSMGLI